MLLPARLPFVRSAALLALAALLWSVSALSAQELKPIALPQAQMAGGMPLMQALARRQTMRAFLDQPLPMQTLSNLLWAAFGVNRPAAVKPGLGRTAPSAMNKQEVELYVVLAQGSTSTRPRATACARWQPAMCAARSAPERLPMQR
jgi:hypothetical protein